MKWISLFIMVSVCSAHSSTLNYYGVQLRIDPKTPSFEVDGFEVSIRRANGEYGPPIPITQYSTSGSKFFGTLSPKEAKLTIDDLPQCFKIRYSYTQGSEQKYSGYSSEPGQKQCIDRNEAAKVVDSDGDGLTDEAEDPNLNGAFEPDLGESDLRNPDTDGDLVPDGEDVCKLSYMGHRMTPRVSTFKEDLRGNPPKRSWSVTTDFDAGFDIDPTRYDLFLKISGQNDESLYTVSISKDHFTKRGRTFRMKKDIQTKALGVKSLTLRQDQNGVWRLRYLIKSEYLPSLESLGQISFTVSGLESGCGAATSSKVTCTRQGTRKVLKCSGEPPVPQRTASSTKSKT